MVIPCLHKSQVWPSRSIVNPMLAYNFVFNSCITAATWEFAVGWLARGKARVHNIYNMQTPLAPFLSLCWWLQPLPLHCHWPPSQGGYSFLQPNTFPEYVKQPTRGSTTTRKQQQICQVKQLWTQKPSSKTLRTQQLFALKRAVCFPHLSTLRYQYFF